MRKYFPLVKDKQYPGNFRMMRKSDYVRYMKDKTPLARMSCALYMLILRQCMLHDLVCGNKVAKVQSLIWERVKTFNFNLKTYKYGTVEQSAKALEANWAAMTKALKEAKV